MIEKSPHSEQYIIDCLKINYGIDVETLTCLPFGADMDALVYKAQTHNKVSYFIKIKRGHDHDISAIIIDFLYSAGVHHIIPTVKTIHGTSIQPIDAFTLSVSPFVHGKDGFSQDLTHNHWCTLGAVMRRIHTIDVSPSLQAKIRKESYTSKWRKAVRALYPLFDTEPTGDRVAVNLLTFMKTHRDTIYRIVDRAEELAHIAKEQSAHYVLCHADLHGGNVFINDNDALFIVDWDDPIMAPKERDLMFIGGGVANVWNKTFEKDLFYKGYGMTDINMTLLAYYRYERIVQDIAEYGQQLLLTMEGGDDRMAWYKDFVAQFDPNGVVDIALKTDEALRIFSHNEESAT